MSHENRASVQAGALLEALMVVVKLNRKRRGTRPPFYISLEAEGNDLLVKDAEFGSKLHRVQCTGRLDEPVQIDGIKLRAAIEKYPSKTEIELCALPNELALVYGSSKVNIPRIDAGGGGIKMRALKPDPKHAGPVTHPPNSKTKRVELADNWSFSARVPMPQHRKSKSEED